jgi:hypothetical protein
VVEVEVGIMRGQVLNKRTIFVPVCYHVMTRSGSRGPHLVDHVINTCVPFASAGRSAGPYLSRGSRSADMLEGLLVVLEGS